MEKKIVALLLAGVMLLSLCACGGENRTNNTVAGSDPLTTDDVIEVIVTSHASWPFNEDWKVLDYIREGVGATVNFTSIPASDASTKIPILFAAPETLPDIINGTSAQSVNIYIRQGGVIALDDMEEYMPNYNKWLNGLSENEYTDIVSLRKYHDGKIYFAPPMGRESSQNVRAWLYRKDVFEKHNLEIPKTFDELYEVCKELKTLYPDSYPYCIRQKLTNLNVSGASWKPYWNVDLYYDFDAEKWCYGAVEDVALEVFTWYHKMVKEGLMPSDFMTMSTSGWQELITTDRGFIMPEYQTRIDFFNPLAREKNPDFDLQAMIPPIAREGGLAMVNKYNVDPVGMYLCNTRDAKRIANAAKYLDWFYSDEAVELVSWGKEGETYEVVDGKKKFILDGTGTQVTSLYGFSTYGMFQRFDPEAVAEMETEEIFETREMVLGCTMPHFNPSSYVSFNDEEMSIIEMNATGLGSYAQEMITKFILGQEPLTKFDEFRDTLYEMGLEDLLKTYESAYSRMK